MERYGYRDKARIISIVDIVWSTINLAHTFISFLAVTAYLSYLSSVDPEHRNFEPVRDASHGLNTGVIGTAGGGGVGGGAGTGRNGDIVFSTRTSHNFRRLAWMMVIAQFAIHFSQLTFAINLYIGTAKNAAAKAPAACRLWGITSSLLLGILSLRLLFFQARETVGIFCLSEIMFRAVGIYLVREYAKEVKNGCEWRRGNNDYPAPPPVYFSSQPQRPSDHLSIPINFIPPHPGAHELPPKYEEIMGNHPTPNLNPISNPIHIISTHNNSSNNSNNNNNNDSSRENNNNNNDNPPGIPTVPVQNTASNSTSETDSNYHHTNNNDLQSSTVDAPVGVNIV